MQEAHQLKPLRPLLSSELSFRTKQQIAKPIDDVIGDSLIHRNSQQGALVKVQGIHATFRVLELMAGLVVGQLGGFGMRLQSIQLFFPTTHENLDFLFRLLGLRIKLGDACILQFRSNIGKQGHPMFTGSIVRICIENNANLVIALFKQLVNPCSTQRIHQAFARF